MSNLVCKTKLGSQLRSSWRIICADIILRFTELKYQISNGIDLEV